MESPTLPSTPMPVATSSGSDVKNFIILILVIALFLSILGVNIFVLFGYFIQFIANLFKPFFASLGYATGTVINTTTDLATDTAKFGVDVAGGAVHDIGNLMISASDKKAIPDFKQNYNQYSTVLMNKISGIVAHPPAQPPSPILTSAQPPSPILTPAQPPAPIQFTTPSMAAPAPSPAPIIQYQSPAMTVDNTINMPPPTMRYMNDAAHDDSSSIIQTPISSKKSNWCLIGEYKDRRGCVEIDDATRCISGQIFPSQQMCTTPTFQMNSSQMPIYVKPPVGSYNATADPIIASNQLF